MMADTGLGSTIGGLARARLFNSLSLCSVVLRAFPASVSRNAWPRAPEEPGFVETLGTEPAVEALDEGILVRLAGSDKVQPNSLRVRSGVAGPADGRGPIVHDQHRRRATRLDETLQGLDDLVPADRGVDLDR